MTNKEERDILCSAILTFGTEHQINKFIEEIGEVLQALTKVRNAELLGNKVDVELTENLLAELADLTVTLDQMKIIFDEERIILYRQSKLDRLKQRIEEHGKPSV